MEKKQKDHYSKPYLKLKMKTKILNFTERFSFLKQIPLFVYLFLKIKTAGKNKMTILVEFQTTNEFFYLKSVLEKLHGEGNLMIFFVRPKLLATIKDLTKQYFPKNTKKHQKTPFLLKKSTFL